MSKSDIESRVNNAMYEINYAIKLFSNPRGYLTDDEYALTRLKEANKQLKMIITLLDKSETR